MRVSLERVQKKEGLNYPVLMRAVHSGKVVLFTDAEVGTVLKCNDDGSGDEIGYHTNVWISAENKNYWRKVDEVLTLRNDD